MFVAVNLFGILPLYIGMSERLAPSDRRNLLIRAITVAVAVSVIMLFAGEIIFRVMQISVNDLRVGGGLILLVLAISDLVFGELKTRRSGEKDDHEETTSATELAVVPLAIPLMVGPAAITTILVNQGQFGYVITLAAVLANLGLVFVTFLVGPSLIARAGKGFSTALAKVASLFLAAIAVAMIRVGIMGMVGGM